MSTGSIDIRMNRPAERDAILAFVAEMGFNPRDAVTWDGLGMVAMTAWDGGRLIGAIPLEPRPLRVAEGVTAPAAHETVVAVRPEFRSRGIGSAMQAAIFERPPAGARVITVFREEPASAAYRWYVRNGFRAGVHIDSWFCDGRGDSADDRVEFFEVADARLPWNWLDDVWRAARRPGGGLVDRTRRPLREWLAVHPYRARYRFGVAVDRGGAGYALYGVGSMHSRGERIDVLEVVSAGAGPQTGERLVGALLYCSKRCGASPVRWPLAAGDPDVATATALGFDKRWGFDMLVRPLDAELDLGGGVLAGWRYAGVDYI